MIIDIGVFVGTAKPRLRHVNPATFDSLAVLYFKELLSEYVRTKYQPVNC